jgi:hypothetical protein
MGRKNWRRNSRTENSGGQFSKMLRSTKDCNEEEEEE